ncbi:MAG: CotH kinase family protein [Bacteroidota bacterium]|nr:CotH kinase family protein [Bacteroidota bacterium]
MNYTRVSKNPIKTFFLFLLLVSCSGPEELDLTNIENGVINFYDDIDETDNASDANTFPTMKISTNFQDIVDEPKINAELLVIENNTEKNYKIGIEIRGSSSKMFPKKSYGIETKSSDWSEDIDVDLGGFPEEEDWILYGPYTDKSLIRNKLTFDLSNSIGFKASNTKFYNLFINEQSKGLYILMEKIKRDKNRVDLPAIEANSIEGGYIIKIDKATGDSSCESCYNRSFSFRSNYDGNGSLSENSPVYFIYHYPKPDVITEDQKSYIQSVIDTFETVLVSDDNFDDINEIIDIDSFVDFFIINELTKNIDGYRLSTYLNKDYNGKLKMGPIWDFNLAFGNADYCDAANTQAWLYNFNRVCPGDLWQVPFWWRKLMESVYFKERLKEKWQLYRSTELSDGSIDSLIDSYVEYLDTNTMISQNFYVWPILGKYVWPNYFIGSSHNQEIDFLKGWISQRLNWMDGQINNF